RVLAQDDRRRLSLRHAGQRLPPSRDEGGGRGLGGTQGRARWCGAYLLRDHEMARSFDWGPRHGPQTPEGPARPGKPGALFDDALRARAETHLDGCERRALPADGRRPAAVAVVLLGDDAGRACFLLTRRAAGLRQHARQWALPGGRLEPGESAVDGARRELS